MFDFLKRKKTETSETITEEVVNSPAEINQPTKVGFFHRLKQGLSKTRKQFTSGLSNLILGKKIVDDALLADLETLLITADLGVNTTDKIIQSLTAKVARHELDNPEALKNQLETELLEILQPCEKPLIFETAQKPFVILVTGVNGVGKTTTIGKLANAFKQEGKSVMLAAGDTFRAAAVEQLQVWGERNNIPVVAQQTGSDSASVIFDAVQSASAKQTDILIADTAGRLHTKNNLMDELKKVDRVIKKLDANAPHETLLVLDAGNGQNALQQAAQFHQAVKISGIVITKLDGTAKGGIIFAIADLLKLPIRYIGVGEGIDDLKPFSAKEFVTALFETEE